MHRIAAVAMSGRSRASGVVISGLYGSGKTTVVEEIADLLEGAEANYGALDLDWLWWFGTPGIQRREALVVLSANLASVVGVYLDAGVTRFVMAWSLRDPSDVSALRAALPFPIKVVELTVPLPLIEQRLSGSVTAARTADLREARRWFHQGLGTGLGDVQIDNDRPVREVAVEILTWLGWL